MLRDVSSSDSLHLKYIIKKIKKMAQGSPNLVMETIHDYLKNNPEVGLLGALGAGTGAEGRAGVLKCWVPHRAAA
jgi:hypothetical protein